VPRRKLVITLIHGTWGRHSLWIKESSRFCKTLRKILEEDVVFKPFLWSGGNSFHARIKATRELERHLIDTARQYPEAAHFAIGHSHGGNALLYALNNVAAAQSLSGIMTISTPYFICSRRDLSNLDTYAYHLSVLPAGVVAGIPFFILSVLVEVSRYWAGWLLMVYILLTLALLYRFMDRFSDWVINRQEQLIHGSRYPAHENLPMLSVTFKLDEASLYLKLLFLMEKPVIFFIYWFGILFGILFVLALWVGILSKVKEPPNWLGIPMMASFTVVFCAYIVGTLVKLVQGQRFGYGVGTVNTFLVKAIPTDSPPNWGLLTVIRYDFWHAVRTALFKCQISHIAICYSDQAIHDIGKWIKDVACTADQ